jgi:hypothetical protein
VPPNNFGFAGDPFINDQGDIVFAADVGVFLGKRGIVMPFAQIGDDAPGGGTLSSINNDVANALDIVAYEANIADGTTTIGLFRTDGKINVRIATDDVAPPTGGTFTAFQGFGIDDRGNVAVSAVMTGGSADIGIFRGNGRELKTVFATNQPAPGGGLFGDFSDPLVNLAGPDRCFRFRSAEHSQSIWNLLGRR